MAKALRRALADRQMELTHSACLEIVARQFGRSDWNVLKASCDAEMRVSITIFVEHGREQDAAAFYATAFEASRTKTRTIAGEVTSVALRLGDMEICVSGANPRRQAEPNRGGPFFPKGDGAVSTVFLLHVGDPDAALRRAVAAGAVVRDRLQVSTDGRRSASFFDPFGHIWAIVERAPGSERRAA
jgi:uncharacterized glyoxalase superfamily protein PhnB